MKKLLFLLSSCFMSLPLNSYAIAALVFDPSVCARLSSEALQLEKQFEVLKEQLASLKPSIKQLSPRQYQWSSTKGLINQLGSSIEETKGLSYSASNLSQQFKENYPGFTPSQNEDAHYGSRTAKTLGTLNGVLNSLNHSAHNFESENARLSFLQSQAKSAVGQTQAIQGAAQIASEQVSQLQLLRQNVMAEATAQSVYYANQVQQEASLRAEVKKVLLSGKTNALPIGHSGHTIDLNLGKPGS